MTLLMRAWTSCCIRAVVGFEVHSGETNLPGWQ